MQCLRAWRRRKEPGSQRFGKCQVNSLVDDWFFGGLSRKTQHFYHLLRNRSCHQQSFSSKILNITCYSCEEKLTFYRTLKRISHMLLIQSANKTMQSRRYAKFKWHNYTASLQWLTKLDVHTRDSIPLIPKHSTPLVLRFWPQMRSSWGKLVNMWWMIQLGKFQICSLLWWTAIVPCQEVAKEYNSPLKSNKTPLPSAWQIRFVWKNALWPFQGKNPGCLILPSWIMFHPSISFTPNTLGEVVNKQWFTSQLVNYFNRLKNAKLWPSNHSDFLSLNTRALVGSLRHQWASQPQAPRLLVEIDSLQSIESIVSFWGIQNLRCLESPFFTANMRKWWDSKATQFLKVALSIPLPGGGSANLWSKESGCTPRYRSWILPWLVEGHEKIILSSQQGVEW